MLLVGSVDVVVPQNLSAAVNYVCVECVTYALATQLVVSLPGELSADGQQALAAIWAELQEFGADIEDVPLAELRDRLTEFEQRILDVVQEHAVDSGEQPVEADDPGAGTTDSGTSGEDGTSDSGTSDGGTSDGDAATSTGGVDSGDGTTDGGGTSGSTGSADPTGSTAPSSTGSAPTSGSTAETTEGTSAGTETATPTAEATPTG